MNALPGYDNWLTRPLLDHQDAIEAQEKRTASIRRQYERAGGLISWTVVVDKHGDTLAEAVFQDLDGTDDLYAAFAHGISNTCCQGDVDIDARTAKSVLNSLADNDFFPELLADWLLQGEDSASHWRKLNVLFERALDNRCELQAIREAA